MNTSNPEKLISDFIKYAEIEGKTKIAGDYKLGNAMAKKINKIFEDLKNDGELAREVIGAILKSDSIRARSLAAVNALRLNIYIEESIEALEDISKDSSIIGFGAEMALKIWRGEFPGKTL